MASQAKQTRPNDPVKLAAPYTAIQCMEEKKKATKIHLPSNQLKNGQSTAVHVCDIILRDLQKYRKLDSKWIYK